MMLMSGGRKDDRRYDREPEDKLRDCRGREHYDNGRYAPRSEMMEPEDRGYRRYSDGRFAPRNDGGMWVDSRYWDDRMYGPQSHYGYPYVPGLSGGWERIHRATGNESAHEQNRIRYLWRRRNENSERV